MKEGCHLFEPAVDSKLELLHADCGYDLEIFSAKREGVKLFFENEYCRFSPTKWVRLDGVWLPLVYKVVTEDLKSLGLRRNPNILTFPLGEWVLQPSVDLVPGKVDFGGIWTALRKGSVTTLKKYCQDTYKMKTRGFLVAINHPMYSNSYRIKSGGVILLKELVDY